MKVQVIKEKDIIPFGKYKGKVLSDVYAQDPSYVQWMIRKVTKYKFDFYFEWKEFERDKMYVEDEKGLEDYYLFSGDGLYLVVFCCNGCDYGLYRQKNGKIIKLFDWRASAAPIAYYRFPEYNPNDPFWGEVVRNGYGKFMTIGAYENESEMDYREISTMLSGASISKLDELDYDDPHGGEALLCDGIIEIKYNISQDSRQLRI